MAPPLCWCRDAYKCVKSTDEWTIGQRYWCCPNFCADYPDRRFDTPSHRQPVMKSYFSAHHYFASCYAVTTSVFPPQSPPCLYDFSQWIDYKINPYDIWILLKQKSWAREDCEGHERLLEEL